MIIFKYIGLIASCIIGISFIPQTYKVIKENDVQSLSTGFVLINIISSLMMCVYGIYYVIEPVIVANSSVLINNLILLYFIIKHRYFSSLPE